MRVSAGAVLRVELRMEELELAKGYDGLLRGAPEPTVIVGVYAVADDHAQLMGRFLYRFERPEGFPCKVATREPSREACSVAVRPGARLVVLALAIEEDSGRGLQALYAELERGDAIVVWAHDQAAPIPLHLSELDDGTATPLHGHRVHVLLGEWDPGATLVGDDWVDAAVLHTLPAVQRERHRLWFQSADGRNEWTAALELAVRRA